MYIFILLYSYTYTLHYLTIKICIYLCPQIDVQSLITSIIILYFIKT